MGFGDSAWVIQGRGGDGERRGEGVEWSQGARTEGDGGFGGGERGIVVAMMILAGLESWDVDCICGV